VEDFFGIFFQKLEVFIVNETARTPLKVRHLKLIPAQNQNSTKPLSSIHSTKKWILQ
jgi:hypothetical protein